MDYENAILARQEVNELIEDGCFAYDECIDCIFKWKCMAGNIVNCMYEERNESNDSY